MLPLKQLLLLFFSPLCMAAQSSSFDYGIFQEGDERLPYRILLPENYTPEKRYPLLVFLHGAGERGADNELQLFHGSTLFLDASIRKNYPAVVVFPQCPQGKYWASVKSRENPLSFEFFKRPKDNPVLGLVEALIEKIVSSYAINQDRLYVGGLSMGGMGTFEMVYRNPKKFAAAFAICGGANPKIAKRIRRPVWRIDHGDADEVVPYALSERMAEALKKQGAEVLFYRHPKVNHNSWENVFADQSFLPWLFSQTK
ncbi:MAG: alpha/beta hydrolase-fold protein [Flavobacteriaceae bacterium]